MMNFPALPSPTVLLVGFALCVGAFAGGAYVGKEYESGQNAKEKVETLGDTLDKIGKLVESDNTLAIQQAEKAAIAKERSRTARSKGINDAMAKASTGCDRDVVSVGLLNDAVDAANGAPRAAGGVRVGVPAATEAGGRVGQSDPGVGVRLN